MRRLLGWLALAATVGLGFSADARMHAPYRGHRIVPAPAPPLDAFVPPTAAYSFRKLRSAYTGNAMRLRRASDNAEVEIGYLGATGFTGAPWDQAAAATHCSATTCFLVTWHDQSGGTRDMAQATAGNQPVLVFNCRGTLPCFRMTLGSAQQAAYVSMATSLTLSMSIVARVAVRGSQGCGFAYVNANTLNPDPALDTVILNNSATSIVAPATVTNWHSYIGIMAGVSSVVRVDSVETAGNLSANTPGAISFATYGGTGATCEVGEWLLWDNYALSAAERAALSNNQKNYWGF